MAKFAVILPAAGRSSRFRDPHYKKPFAILGGRAVWLHSAERFLNRDDVVQLIVIIAAEDREQFFFKYSSNVTILGIDVVEGGAERADSVAKALAQVKPEADFVCVHDAARPCLAGEWIDAIFAAARKAARQSSPLRSRHNQTRRAGQDDPRDRRPRRPLGSPNAPGLPPPAPGRRLRQARKLCRHRRRPTGRATRPRGDHRARLAGEPENHHERRPPPGRASVESPAQAKIAGADHPFADDDMWR